MKKIAAKTKTLLICAVVFFVMVFLTATSPLIYTYICKVTGIEGTPRRSDGTEAIEIIDKKIDVFFDVTVDAGLPWTVYPKDKKITVNLGEVKTAYYHVKNNSDKEITAMAVYNVQPDSVGSYFNKIICFCFEKQTLKPGEEADFRLEFYVDPKMIQQTELQDLTEMTLSYTFYPSEK